LTAKTLEVEEVVIPSVAAAWRAPGGLVWLAAMVLGGPPRSIIRTEDSARGVPNSVEARVVGSLGGGCRRALDETFAVRMKVTTLTPTRAMACAR
jgi:hypothetical protein